ncbi:hypothetical protein HBDW_26800 [Herbaspirillum sp. DW155]|uniref:hypothetical protein n=1 Tax=Herbaspirillum sp. DW155 TaxID=3095609 RepID=UPI003090F2DB|nr:hypothetical protein HBDW_26800 [Herbaspirillum sp. DW155]
MTKLPAADLQLPLFTYGRRGEILVAEAAGVYLDYSKNLVTTETMGLLMQLARQCDLPDRIEAMFRADPINVTEQRPALHTALRMPAYKRLVLDPAEPLHHDSSTNALIRRYRAAQQASQDR